MTEAIAAPTIGADSLALRRQAVRLFVVGFLVLFLELACIRWFGANVVFLQFFSNVVLIASFLGMSCGCLASQRPQDWLGWFPLIALGTVVAALAVSGAYNYWRGGRRRCRRPERAARSVFRNRISQPRCCEIRRAD
jgi:hypothetical protein